MWKNDINYDKKYRSDEMKRGGPLYNTNAIFLIAQPDIYTSVSLTLAAIIFIYHNIKRRLDFVAGLFRSKERFLGTKNQGCHE